MFTIDCNNEKLQIPKISTIGDGLKYGVVTQWNTRQLLFFKSPREKQLAEKFVRHDPIFILKYR